MVVKVSVRLVLPADSGAMVELTPSVPRPRFIELWLNTTSSELVARLTF